MEPLFKRIGLFWGTSINGMDWKPAALMDPAFLRHLLSEGKRAEPPLTIAPPSSLASAVMVWAMDPDAAAQAVAAAPRSEHSAANSEGLTPLMQACFARNLDAMDALIAAAPESVSAVGAVNGHPLTALMLACSEGATQCVTRLLRSGVDAAQRVADPDGIVDAFAAAMVSGHVRILQMLKGQCGIAVVEYWSFGWQAECTESVLLWMLTWPEIDPNVELAPRTSVLAAACMRYSAPLIDALLRRGAVGAAPACEGMAAFIGGQRPSHIHAPTKWHEEQLFDVFWSHGVVPTAASHPLAQAQWRTRQTRLCRRKRKRPIRSDVLEA